MGSESPSPSLFTADDLHTLFRQEAEVRKKLEAARTLIGDEQFARLRGAEAPDDAREISQTKVSRVTFRSIITDLLNSEDRAFSYDEIKDHIRETELAEQFLRNENSFFNTLGRLEKLGKVFRVRKYALSASAHEALAAGRISLPEGVSHSPDSNPDLVLRVLKSSPKALTSAEVLEAIDALPERTGMPKIGQGVYAALSRLAKNGTIEKAKLGGYQMPRQDGGDNIPEIV